MSDDDRFDEFLRNAARDYNAPPPTPRDAMWARIDTERRARAARQAPHPLPLRRLWWPLVVGIAAALVIGVGIGRWWGTHESGGRQPAVASTNAPRTPAAPTETSRAAAPSAPVVGTPKEQVAVREPAATSTTPAPAARDAAARRFYEAAAIDHLGRAEALLTSFRAESKTGTVDAQVTAWAGDLLGTTRLLLDSPATEDPRLRKLLGDLEVVLAQIAQLHPKQGTPSDELQIIDQAVRQRDMMTRLRTAIPAGALPTGS
ncbi:MAG TPA: hypothetical protein VFS44_12035 [Gemmatimonadaceae bacterium]|nr:hypothetical protein [Gemmatimonadaceae bacterium]